MRRALGMQEEKASVLFGRSLIDGVMFPLLLLTLAAGLFLALGEYHRKERVRGVLRGVGSDALLHAEAPGVVSAVLVRPGERVAAGQPPSMAMPSMQRDGLL